MAQLADRTMLESVFPLDDLVTVAESRLGLVMHQPTLVLLRDVGLPDRPASWFEVSEEICEGELEIGFEERAEEYPQLAFRCDQWIGLGGIGADDVAVDASTGAVYCLPETGAPYLLSSSLDAFLYFLWLPETERPNYDNEAAGADIESTGADQRLRVRMEEADPMALQDPVSLWNAVLHGVSTNLSAY